jgi:hypothetical protein
MSLKLFVGYDSRESEAYDVFVHSVTRLASKPITIIPLRQDWLREMGLYTRPEAEPAATQFSFTRFLVPFLSNYEGTSIFADCDMLAQTDIWEVLAYADPQYAVSVCKHDYEPKTAMKMDGQAQVKYPRKNWSSFMVFNNASCRVLSPDYVNRVTGRELHQFYWLGSGPESRVGALPLDWNWLVDEYEQNPTARVLHYTLGGPWFAETKNCDHADLWLQEQQRLRG